MDHYTRPDFAKAALLSVDVQRDLLEGGPLAFANPTAVLSNMIDIATAFRAVDRPIVHVVRLYLPDGSNADLCRRAALERGASALVVGTPGAELVSDLVPDGGALLNSDALLAGEFQALSANEIVMYKPRWGAFYATPLLEHIHALEITTVVIIGCNFPNCPRATAVEASERDLRVVVVTDALSRFDDHVVAEMGGIGVATMTSADVVKQLQISHARASPSTDLERKLPPKTPVATPAEQRQ